jgi:hypothetical protein
MRVHRVLKLATRTWTTTLNCAGRVTLTRHGSSEPERLSERSSAGNPAGKSPARCRNILTLFTKSPEFESSPEHHIFIISQNIKTRYSTDLESVLQSNLRAHYK